MVDPGDLKSSCRCSAGSSPVARTILLKRPLRLEVRTPPFHGDDTGSNPVGVTSLIRSQL